MRKLILGAAAAALSLGLMASVASAASVATDSHGATKAGKVTGTAELVLVHAIDGAGGMPVDVSVTGPNSYSKTATGVTAGTVTDLTTLVRGTYTVTLKNGTTTLTRRVTLGRFSSKTMVAKLDANGKNPSLAVFNNVVNGFGRSFGRVTVIHAASTGPIDVTVGTKKVIRRLTNGMQAGRIVKAGTLSNVSLVNAGTTTALMAPTNVTVTARHNTVVVAYGLSGSPLKTTTFTLS
jgi:hypothetical protein